MAVCESQLESKLRLNREDSNETSQDPPLPAGLPLTVDYRSPVSHFVPPHVELYARHKQGSINNAESPESTPVKRKRGRPRVDKTSPEYLASVAARKQAREMAAMSRGVAPAEGKRKRGRPRLDKTSPEYLARKRAREIEALERKAKRDYKRHSTADSGASSSTGDTTPRVKRKYTKRAPSAKKNDGSAPAERAKGKRGRPRKEQLAPSRTQQPPKIRVRSNLMPVNNEPISLDSDDEPNLGSPGAASDSLSLDENLRALRHIHEKYANIDKDDLYEAHLLAANFKKPAEGSRMDDDVLSVRSSEGGASVKEVDTRIEKLEDSSNSDSDSSSSGSDSSSSGSSSSSSCSSDSSSSSDSEGEAGPRETNNHVDNTPYPPAPWAPVADSDSDPERVAEPTPPSHDEISESDNESPDKSFQCHICRKWYSTRVTLKIHRRGHQNRGGGTSRSRARNSDRYTCDICTVTFPRREKLYAHKAEAHRGSMTFRCEVCRRCFEHDDELARHLNTHTEDDRNGQCTECKQSFESYSALAAHRAHAHAADAAHSCAHCGKRFTHVHSLTRHLHNHAKQLYRCVVCKASFARADQLAQHLNSHLANYKRLKP